MFAELAQRLCRENSLLSQIDALLPEEAKAAQPKEAQPKVILMPTPKPKMPQQSPQEQEQEQQWIREEMAMECESGDSQDSQDDIDLRMQDESQDDG